MPGSFPIKCHRVSDVPLANLTAPGAFLFDMTLDYESKKYREGGGEYGEAMPCSVQECLNKKKKKGKKKRGIPWPILSAHALPSRPP